MGLAAFLRARAVASPIATALVALFGRRKLVAVAS